jgi:NADP-dependent 3-hydroxy acid dehydrogenase YdfG
MEEFYQIAITPEAVAKTVLFAIQQPDEVAITEMTILPSVQA